MQAEFKKDIKYFVVQEKNMDTFFYYEDAYEFFEKNIGSELMFHIGHKEGFCCCRENAFGVVSTTSFNVLRYPCIYSRGVIENIQEVEPVESHEGSVDFTIGRQTKNRYFDRMFIVGVSGIDDIKEELNRILKEGAAFTNYGKSREYCKSSEEDMIKIFGICTPRYAREFLFMQPEIGSPYHHIPPREKGVKFESNTTFFLNEDKGNRFIDYSMDSHHKYHTLLCD